jgi:hypothetical protein
MIVALTKRSRRWLGTGEQNARHSTVFATGIVDLNSGKLIEIVAGRSRKVLNDWLIDQPQASAAGIKVAGSNVKRAGQPYGFEVEAANLQPLFAQAAHHQQFAPPLTADCDLDCLRPRRFPAGPSPTVTIPQKASGGHPRGT